MSMAIKNCSNAFSRLEIINEPEIFKTRDPQLKVPPEVVGPTFGKFNHPRLGVNW